MSSPTYKPNPQAPWIFAQDGDIIRIHEVAYIPAELSANRNGLYVTAIKNGVPHYGEPFDMLLPGSVDHFAITPDLVTDLQGGTIRNNQPGPFKFVFGDCSVWGFGLPENRHARYVIVVDYGGSVPTPPAPPATGAAAVLTAQQVDAHTVTLKVS